MKRVVTLLFVLLSFSKQAETQTSSVKYQKLYPISENGLRGYINQTGQVVVNPRFRSAGTFTEGLAPVRLNGTYGYINVQGEFVIEPVFDVAYNFHQGIAKVYIDQKPYFINTEGLILFEHDFLELKEFSQENVAMVISKDTTYGLINRKGQLITNTFYEEITPFSHGVAIITGKGHNPFPKKDKSKRKHEVGVIGPSGNFIVPFGKYTRIQRFINGFAEVEFNLKGESQRGVIDHKGNLKFIMPDKHLGFPYYSQLFSEGLATINIYTVDRDTMKYWSGRERYNYTGVIDTSGKIVFSNEDWDLITPFYKGRAFVQDIKNDWYLINKQGEILNTEPYQDILYSSISNASYRLFENGIDFIKTNKGWTGIDLNGNEITETRYKDVPSRYFQRTGDILIIQKDSRVPLSYDSYKYGLWDTKNESVVKAQFHNITFPEAIDELINVVENKQMGYINRKGEYIWKQKKETETKNENLNIDYMNRGYFYAFSPDKKFPEEYNGWGTSLNSFNRISIINDFRFNQFNMVVDTEKKALFSPEVNGVSLYLANTEKDTIFFNAQDSRLYLKVQAKDKKGNWRDIEYTPSSWCGNSYHMLFLPPDYFWEFTIPQYEGDFKTKLRAQLLYLREKDQEGEHIIFSNEFDGSINPGQFWRTQAYYPSNIMDPYNN